MKHLLLILLVGFSLLGFCDEARIQPGAARLDLYLPMLQGKRVAVFANQTSLIGNTPLIDVLLEHHIQIVKIFVPEHGFRGDADAGRQIKNDVDPKTGIKIISLYGDKVKPTTDDLSNVDVLVFDIQDVGVRFYTYISSLQRLMEAAVENNKPLIVLDRPNPNGFYVDGPVLSKNFRGFTAMQSIPVVYGMTMGEYAKMLVGEQWLQVTPKSRSKDLKLTVIPCINYTHRSLYIPPVRPSPNLPDIQSIYLYPAIGMLESTNISVGRGTDKPFQMFGHPLYHKAYTFIPRSRPGEREPMYQDEVCHGWNLAGTKEQVLHEVAGKLQIKYILMAYKEFPNKKQFFDGSLWGVSTGNSQFRRQIEAGLSEEEIRKSWQPALNNFKIIRKKYLLYPDFE